MFKEIVIVIITCYSLMNESLKENKQLAFKFLREPFMDATIVGQNGEKPTQQ